MGLIKRLFRVTRHQKLPRLRHHLTNGRAMDIHDESAHLLLEAGVMRDWNTASQLIKKRGKTAEDLFWELSKPFRPNWRKRLKHAFIRAFGAMPHHPHRAELMRIKKGIFNYDGAHSRSYRIMPRVGSGAKHTRRPK